MVSLPVRRQTKSSTKLRRSSSDSPVFRSERISTIIGTITFIQPERISERVPSKSNSTTRAFRADTPGLTFSTILHHCRNRSRSCGGSSGLKAGHAVHQIREAVDHCCDDGADYATQDGHVPHLRALG